MTDAISDWSSNNMSTQVGALYRHFKGGLYVVLAVLQPSGDEDKRWMVAYMNLETGKKYWRPLNVGEDAFEKPAILDGLKSTRFTFCGYAEEIKIDRVGKFYVTHKY